MFSDMSALKTLILRWIQIGSVPDGVFSGLTMLDTLDVGENPVHPLLLTVSVEMAGRDRVRAKVPAGAPYAMILPVSVTNGGLTGGASTLIRPITCPFARNRNSLKSSNQPFPNTPGPALRTEFFLFRMSAGPDRLPS